MLCQKAHDETFARKLTWHTLDVFASVKPTAETTEIAGNGYLVEPEVASDVKSSAANKEIANTEAEED